MKFSTSILSQVALLASTSYAAPAQEFAKPASLARRGPAFRSNPMIRLNHTGPSADDSFATEYSGNWGGAIQNPPSGDHFTSASTQFNVPSVSAPGGASAGTQYSGCAWVGIDGSTNENAILQSGINWHIQNGQVSYEAWYEWFPIAQVGFNGGPSMSPGDQISVSLHSTSPTTGEVTLENLTTGKSVTTTASAPSASNSLTGQNAEWIVEDYSAGSEVPFAHFSPVTFTNCQAGTAGGKTLNAEGATLIYLEENNEYYVTSSIPSASNVDCTYGGP